MPEQLTLFGPNEGLKPIKRTKSKNETFQDYEGFVTKFETKKTTDDCYTPEPVFNAVVEFVSTLTPLDGRPIVRPFFPGGDYEAHEYPENCIVIDNLPFSILSKILRFYSAHGVELKIPKAACRYIADSDEARRHGRSLFGGGYLLSERAAAERAAAERAAAERAAATELNISPRERLIIEELNKCY